MWSTLGSPRSGSDGSRWREINGRGGIGNLWRVDVCDGIKYQYFCMRFHPPKQNCVEISSDSALLKHILNAHVV